MKFRSTTPFRRFELDNRKAAAIVLADPTRYGGPTSAIVRWAQLVNKPVRPTGQRTQP